MTILIILALLVGSHAQLNLDLIGNGIRDVQQGVTRTLSTGDNNGATNLLNNSMIENGGNVIDSLTSTVKKEAGAVTQPVESAVLLTASSQCKTVKKLLGVDYSGKSLLKDEDLDQIELEFITSEMRVVYNIGQAAELISASRNFNASQPLIFIAHGFLNSPDNQGLTEVLDALYTKGQYNVLVLDSSAYFSGFYLRATTYVRYIGEKLGAVLATLVQHGFNPNAIHLVGHSLGAQICGFTGKEFTRLTGLRLGRITGLDPAGPCFVNAGSELRLNATDATFVDVLHTNHGAFGITEPAGDVDFYPNGGTQQPDCVVQLCSHNRVWYLFKDSILYPSTFVAVRCDSWSQFRDNQCGPETALMGYYTNSNARGSYFLQTGSKSPYGLGEAGAHYTANEGILKSQQSLGPEAPLG